MLKSPLPPYLVTTALSGKAAFRDRGLNRLLDTEQTVAVAESRHSTAELGAISTLFLENYQRDST